GGPVAGVVRVLRRTRVPPRRRAGVLARQPRTEAADGGGGEGLPSGELRVEPADRGRERGPCGGAAPPRPPHGRRHHPPRAVHPSLLADSRGAVPVRSVMRCPLWAGRVNDGLNWAVAHASGPDRRLTTEGFMSTDEKVLVIPTGRFRAAGYFHGFKAADAD